MSSAKSLARRAEIVTCAAELFSRHGYAAVGMDAIGAAAGVTGPAIYRHFPSKAAVLAAVFEQIIDAIEATAPVDDLPAPQALRVLIDDYARTVAARRDQMAVFVREVHALPDEQADQIRVRQRRLVARWRTAVAAVHPEWDAEQVRTAVHGAFGLLNAVGTFSSPLTDEELAEQLSALCAAALDS